jgi:hypothetical protein
MTSDPASSRRYSDEEVKQLLNRASELESQGALVPAKVKGPTLVELESIASEAGIDPALVRRAALELDSPTGGFPAVSPEATGVLGAPLEFTLQRTVPGEVDTAVLESLVPHIQRVAEGIGHPSLMGRTLSWQSESPQKLRILQVSATVGRGETRLSIEERYSNMAQNLFAGIMGGGGVGVGLGVGLGVGIGALGSVAFAIGFPILALGGAFAISRAIFRASVRGRMHTLTKLMNELVATVEDGLEEDGLEED